MQYLLAYMTYPLNRTKTNFYPYAFFLKYSPPNTEKTQIYLALAIDGGKDVEEAARHRSRRTLPTRRRRLILRLPCKAPLLSPPRVRPPSSPAPIRREPVLGFAQAPLSRVCSSPRRSFLRGVRRDFYAVRRELAAVSVMEGVGGDERRPAAGTETFDGGGGGQVLRDGSFGCGGDGGAVEPAAFVQTDSTAGLDAARVSAEGESGGAGPLESQIEVSAMAAPVSTEVINVCLG